jgi:hypothetical protein
MPGDTYGSLKKLLNERSDIGLSLSHSSAYCFDSESFRYLAAFKQGVIMENKPDFDNSWNKSREEAERMLKYFRTKEPHPVKSTLSLNGTRTLITKLTKPMAEISKQISANIAAMEDDVRLLQDARLTGDKLRQKLRPEMTLLRLKATTDPRTVCSGEGCMVQKDDGTGKSIMIIDYPHPCHAPCGLDNVPVDVLAYPDLAYCAAFSGNENCQRCSHHWTLHKHYVYELEIYKARITDTTIEQQMKQHATDITLRETAIKNRKQLMVEWRAEHEKIRDAAAKFGLWMKANSILPINDATLAYLDILIKDEQAKVDAGGLGNKKVLADLEEDKRKHEELVAVLEASMKDTGKKEPIKQDEVEQIVNSLYNLKHFGKSLEELQIGIAQAHEMTNRELPHRVSHRHMSRGNHTRSSSSHRPTQYQSHGNPQPGQHHMNNGHLHLSQASMGPAKLQRPQSANPGFASGTMRGNSRPAPGGLQPMPGSFMVEVPSQGTGSSSLMRGKSQKQKGFGISSFLSF